VGNCGYLRSIDKEVKLFAAIYHRLIRRVAAAICYRYDKEGDIEFLLIRTSDGNRWTFPKGKIEKGETPYEAAAREAKEEAGVIGKVESVPVAHYRFPTKGLFLDILNIRKRKGAKVAAFLLKVEALEPDYEEKREPGWFNPDEAKKKLTENRELKFVREHNKVIEAAVGKLTKSSVDR